MYATKAVTIHGRRDAVKGLFRAVRGLSGAVSGVVSGAVSGGCEWGL